MARARNIKPGFFANEDLVELDFATRLLFIGLWTHADKEGRFEDRPKKIKIALFPADNVDVDAMLQSLHGMGFVTRYEVNGQKYVQITNWAKHQNPHHTEKPSEIPDMNGEITVKDTLKKCDPPKSHGGNLADSLIPDSLIQEDSVTDVTVGHAVKSPEDMTRDELWTAGKSLLSVSMPAKQCGSFVGKLVKDYGDQIVVDAVRAAVVARPADPAEYLKAICMRAKGERLPPNKQVAIEQRNQAAVDEWLQQQGVAHA